MRLRLAVLLLLGGTLSAHAQVPHFNHVVLVIQENRTPDNLLRTCKIPGADLESTDIGSPVALAHGIQFVHSHKAALANLAGVWPAGSEDYVQACDVQPYCQLAVEYGFANRFFQTNQGPSFTSHQFLVSGTSAPSDTSPLFVSDNPLPLRGDKGCFSDSKEWVYTIDPNGKYGKMYPCFTRSSLLQLLDQAGLSWRYYGVPGKSIWLTPWTLTDYYTSANVILKPKKFLGDIKGGRLANVSWVTPTGACSDHPPFDAGCGPSWVTSIVNTIGQSPYWQDTVIFVLWDDWGGYFDHVPPPPSLWAPQYTYNFRVPLLVISAATPANYVSNETADFGSLLRFVEDNFGLPLIGPGTFADFYAEPLDPGYFSETARTFTSVKARALTPKELEDTSEPDND